MDETNGNAKTKKGVGISKTGAKIPTPSDVVSAARAALGTGKANEPKTRTDEDGVVWYAVPEEPTLTTNVTVDATQPSPSDPNLFSLKDDVTLAAIAQAISVARVNRPTIHGERQRRYAIVLTQLEQVYAYCKTFVVNAENV